MTRVFKNPIQQLVVGRLEALGLSLREAAAQSPDAAGRNGISHSTLARFSRGEFVGHLRPETVSALGRALRVAEHVVWEAAEATARPAIFARLSRDFHRMSPAEQRKVTDLMEEIYEAVEQRERERLARERPLG